MMRDALAPPNSTRPVYFEEVDETADGPSSRLDTGPKEMFAEFGWKVNEEDEDDALDPNEN